MTTSWGTRVHPRTRWKAVLAGIGAAAWLAGASRAESTGRRWSELDTRRLEHALADRIDRVDEFRFIRQRAGELGLRVWLFGGTAASFAHYVAWDLRREDRSENLPKERFDYASASIYRLGQDLDLVFDGPVTAAETLEAELRERYRHFQGEKSAWELRPLRKARGNKLPVLGGADFGAQHTDSQSVGLVEITLSAEPTVRDALAWNASPAPFLVDTAKGRIRYLYSTKHGTTARAVDGLNPDILSAIRFLIKQQQFGLRAEPGDWAQVRAVCEAYDPAAPTHGYVFRWLHRNVPKIVRFAVDVEDAFRVLDALGLREKLVRLGNPEIVGSMPWWLSRKPLRSFPLGQGDGATAGSLRIGVVAHETTSLEVLEGIVRHPGDEPVVLVSRQDAAGENARYGEGFYTRVGDVGGRNTGYTVRFALDPAAREAVDFVRVGDDYVLVLNRAALKVLPDAIDARPRAFIALLEAAKPEHRGLVERVAERVFRKLPELDEAAERELAGAVAYAIENYRGEMDDRLLDPWFASAASQKRPELFEALYESAIRHDRFAAGVSARKQPTGVFARAAARPQWSALPRTAELLDRFVRHGFHPDAIRYALVAPEWIRHPKYGEWIRWMAETPSNEKRIIEHLLGLPQAGDQPELAALLGKYFRRQDLRAEMYVSVFRKSHWACPLGDTWLKWAISKGDGKSILSFVLPTEHWLDRPETIDLVEQILQEGKDPSELVRFLEAQMPARERAFAFRWIPGLLEAPVPGWRKVAAHAVNASRWILGQFRVDVDPRGQVSVGDFAFAEYLASKPEWLEAPEGRLWWLRLWQRGVVSKKRLRAMITDRTLVAAVGSGTEEADAFVSVARDSVAEPPNGCAKALAGN